jgi:hypothetical protein
MRIPNVPQAQLSMPDGGINTIWASFFQNLITQMRLNLSDEGYVVPFKTDDEILQLNNTDNVGKILYNTTTQRMMINNSGTFENIQV